MVCPDISARQRAFPRRRRHPLRRIHLELAGASGMHLICQDVQLREDQKHHLHSAEPGTAESLLATGLSLGSRQEPLEEIQERRQAFQQTVALLPFLAGLEFEASSLLMVGLALALVGRLEAPEE